jgi:[ribosomal protein S5]-alanine N-acetyltransferase
VTPVLWTVRLELRRVELTDAAFFLQLLNEPSWLLNIGDRGVRSASAAESYIRGRIWSQYEIFGYGMYVVCLRDNARPMGICGLVKREFLAAPDLGVALLPDSVGSGFAAEAARAVITDAELALGIRQLFAITKSANRRSVAMLGRLDFRHEGSLAVPPEGDRVELYARP